MGYPAEQDQKTLFAVTTWNAVPVQDLPHRHRLELRLTMYSDPRAFGGGEIFTLVSSSSFRPQRFMYLHFT